MDTAIVQSRAQKLVSGCSACNQHVYLLAFDFEGTHYRYVGSSTRPVGIRLLEELVCISSKRTGGPKLLVEIARKAFEQAGNLDFISYTCLAGFACVSQYELIKSEDWWARMYKTHVRYTGGLNGVWPLQFKDRVWRYNELSEHGQMFIRDKISEGLRTYHDNNPEASAMMSLRAFMRYEDVNFRDKISSHWKSYWSDQVNRDSQSERLRGFYESNPDALVDLSERMKTFFSTQEAREQQSARLKAFYETRPEVRSEMSRKSKEYYAAHPERLEAIGREHSRPLWLKNCDSAGWVRFEKVQDALEYLGFSKRAPPIRVARKNMIDFVYSSKKNGHVKYFFSYDDPSM